MPPEATTDAADKVWVVKQLLFEDVLRELDDRFQRLHIDYMPIKGAYLICAGLAQKFKSRTMNDVDILVGESDFGAVVSSLSNMPGVSIHEGSWPSYKKGWPFEVTFHYPLEPHTCLIDVHKLINLPQRFYLPPRQLFARGSRQGQRVLPSKEDALMICLCHLFVHFSHGFSETALDDIPVLIGQSIDWDKFWNIAATSGAAAFFYYVLKVYEKENGGLRIPFPKKTLKFRYAQVLPGFSTSGNVAFYTFLFRRLCIELPLCRDPIGLVLDKLERNGRGGERLSLCVGRADKIVDTALAR